MATTAIHELRGVDPNSESESAALPNYAAELSNFHRAFAAELRALVFSLPLGRHMQVLDVCCGDGFYMQLFSERLVAPGGITGLDVNPACLHVARARFTPGRTACEIDFLRGKLDHLPRRREWDF